MTTWNPHANELFLKALELSSAGERRRYLDGACGGDAGLRAEVESLLDASARAGNFLELPAVGAPAVGEGAGAVIGPYKLLEQIGEGGFGVVFMADQTRPVRRRVALKVLKPGMDTRQVVARFEAERQALALMEHPNIARVFDGGSTPAGRPYFVMELVRGVPITDYCDKNRLAPPQRLELFISVCQAVQHAHHKGVIHRDLKPSNVLVTLHDTTPVVKVIDFGVAKALGQELTDKTLFTGFVQMIGTPMYMSPEQAGQSGLDVDTRSDVYSLGVLLYELLTGTTPIQAHGLQSVGFDEMRRIIREDEPARPSARVSTLGEAAGTVSVNRQSDPGRLRRLMRGELDWVVMKALEKDRNRRYESASAFAADVQRYLRDEPVLACPPSAWYRFRKFARRSKAVVGVAALVLFFVVLIGSGVGWAARDRAARRARLNSEIGHALDDGERAREQAAGLTDHPYRWEAALAEAGSALKRARGLESQDPTAVEPPARERLQALQAALDADEADRRFAARFEEIRLEQAEVNVAISDFKTGIGFAAVKEALRSQYQVEFGTTPAEQVVALIGRRPKAMRDLLLAALDVCLENAPRDDLPARDWLAAVLDAADDGPWRKRARQAAESRDWEALNRVIDEALAARQPPSLLLRLAQMIPWDGPILTALRRVRRAYPGDFWANHVLACYLHYSQSPYLEEALRYYTAALALRPGNPGACVNLGNALVLKGDLEGAVVAFRDALDGHPDYSGARRQLARALERKGDLDGAVAELRESTRHANGGEDHLWLGNLLWRGGRRDEAIDSYRKAIAIDPDLATARYNLGCALLEKGATDEAVTAYRGAIASYRHALEVKPEDSVCYNGFAWALVTNPYAPLRDPGEGVRLARKAVELGPRAASHWNTLGVAQYRAGNWDEAVAALTKCVRMEGGDSSDFFFLAMAYWQRGDKDQARQTFDQGVRWMDKNRPTSKELGRFRAEAAELLKVGARKE